MVIWPRPSLSRQLKRETQKHVYVSEPLPVFLISFNRGRMLLQTIAGLRKQDRETRIIVHDNGSDDDETLAILNCLQYEDVAVRFGNKISHADELMLICETIGEYFQSHKVCNYAVSDCDVDLSASSHGPLTLYEKILEEHTDIDVAGPLMRLRDVPREYVLFNQAMNSHIHQVWKNVPLTMTIDGHIVHYCKFPIDTTLAVHQAGATFARLRSGIRLYEPYDARHLDWYLIGDDPDHYTKSSNPAITHWNNAVGREMYKGVELIYQGYYGVRQSGKEYEIYWHDLNSAGPNLTEMRRGI